MQANYLQLLDEQRNKFEELLLKSSVQFLNENSDVDLYDFLEHFTPSKKEILGTIYKMKGIKKNSTLCENTGLFVEPQPQNNDFNDAMQQDLAFKILNDDIRTVSESVERLINKTASPNLVASHRARNRPQPRYDAENDSDLEIVNSRSNFKDSFVRQGIKPGEIAKIIIRKSKSAGKDNNVSFGVEEDGGALETVWIYRHQH